MKKLIYTVMIMFSLAVMFTSCREEKSPEEKIEEAMDEVGDDLENASDDVQDAMEDVQDEIEEVKADSQDQ